MKELFRVRRCNGDGTAQVVPLHGCAEACDGCGGCARELCARNPIGAPNGQVVRVRMHWGPVIMAAAAYGLPVALMLPGLIAQRVPHACAGLLLGLCGAVAYDRLVARKQKIIYTITGPAFVPGHREKGEHDLD